MDSLEVVSFQIEFLFFPSFPGTLNPSMGETEGEGARSNRRGVDTDERGKGVSPKKGCR